VILAQRVARGLDPEEDEADHGAGADDDHGREGKDVLCRELEDPRDDERGEHAERAGEPQECAAHGHDYPVRNGH